MMKAFELLPVYIDHIDQPLEEGKLYISKKYKLAIHLCACGCGQQSVTPFTAGEWELTEEEEGTVTLRPSIGNFIGENPYHAHYYITKNKVEWL